MIKTQCYYKRLYKKFIKSRLNLERDGYIERHHIKPRALGGSDEPSNLINLTPREHFFAHLLLVKMYPNNIKIIKGLSAMACGDSKQLNSWQYYFIKKTVTKKMPPKDVLEKMYYKDNLSFKAISKVFSVSDMTVCKWFKMYKLKAGTKSKYRFNTYDSDTVKRLYRDGGIMAIQKFYKISFTVLYRWLKECKVCNIRVIGTTKTLPCKNEFSILYFKGYSLKHLSKHYKVTTVLIRKWVEHFNLERRPRIKRIRSLKNF